MVFEVWREALAANIKYGVKSIQMLFKVLNLEASILGVSVEKDFQRGNPETMQHSDNREESAKKTEEEQPGDIQGKIAVKQK